MKIFLVILVILFATPLVYAAENIPSSPRSRQAISRVEPKLQQALSKEGLKWGAPIFIRILKKPKKLEIWLRDKEKYKRFKTYEICTYGDGSLGPKVREGDGKAPEGFYFVTPNRMNPLSSFHLSFDLGYPNNYDRAHGRTGSALMIHGDCVSIGCYAMTNKGIEEIYALADAAYKKGQRFFRVHIFPFKMTDENMERHRNSEWIDFWRNLKEGYDFFENNNHIPPNIRVRNRRYFFEHS